VLERLVAAVLAGRSQPVAALAAFAASPDGARVLVHNSGIAARALRALQDAVAAKEWRRLLPTLQASAAALGDGWRVSVRPHIAAQRLDWHHGACVMSGDSSCPSTSPFPCVQVLTALCSQPEGQRALLACSTPSDTMLGVLLSLAEHSAPASAAAAAAAAAVLLRQLALCPEAKAHFVSRRGALQTLLDAVSAAGAQPERAVAAVHALWALVHGGERVKVAVRRCEGWEQALGAALAACGQEQPALKSGVKALLSLLAK